MGDAEASHTVVMNIWVPSKQGVTLGVVWAVMWAVWLERIRVFLEST